MLRSIYNAPTLISERDSIPSNKTNFGSRVAKIPQAFQWWTLSGLEQVYAKAHKAGSFSHFKALKASFYYVLYFVTSIEFIFMTLGAFLILANSGLYATLIEAQGVSIAKFWTIIALLSIMFFTFNSFFLTALKLIYGWSIWSLTGAIAFCVAAFVTLSMQIFFGTFINGQSFSFFQTLALVFGMYGSTCFVIVFIHEKNLSFRVFETRANAGDISLEIPIALRGEIMAISALDQTIQIMTERGTFKMRSSLTNAIKKIHDVAGLKVHRSHWVAVAAMQKIDTLGDRNWIILKNGQSIPVSAKKIDTLRELLGAPSSPSN